ncbi:MAG: hypothetical protein NVSMB64_06270 [Candidatus Velthaea sp.]
MANTLLTPSLITKEALMVLENNAVFTKFVNKEYSPKFGSDSAIGQKIGNTLQVRKPPKYVGRSGAAIAVEDATEQFVNVVLNTQRGVDIQFSSQELTLSIDEFSDRFIKPAVAKIANFIDADGLALYKTVANSVGTPGITPNALLTYLNAGVAMDITATPRDGQRSVVIAPQPQATIVDALKGLFQDSSDIAKQYRDGTMGRTAGLKFSMDQNVVSQTVGPLGGAPLVNGAAQTGSSLITNGWTAAAALRLNQGDVFTIAGVFSVNPMSLASTGVLQQFVVTANVSSDGAGNATIPISPSIILTTGFQTVNASPANGAALTVVGAASTVSPQGLAFHRDAFTLATADLEMPKGVDFSARMASKQAGVSIRMVRAYNISTDQFPCRLDVLYGWASLRPEMACRVQC